MSSWLLWCESSKHFVTPSRVWYKKYEIHNGDGSPLLFLLMLIICSYFSPLFYSSPSLKNTQSTQTAADCHAVPSWLSCLCLCINHLKSIRVYHQVAFFMNLVLTLPNTPTVCSNAVLLICLLWLSASLRTDERHAQPQAFLRLNINMLKSSESLEYSLSFVASICLKQLGCNLEQVPFLLLKPNFNSECGLHCV